MSSEMPSEQTSTQTAPLALLLQVRKVLSQKDLAARLQVAPKTVSRWENQHIDCPVILEAALRDILRSASRPEPSAAKFTFIDLFAGIGGMRVGFEQAGGRCVFTSEWNEWSQKTYKANFGNDEIAGDIVLYDVEEIPDHDVLLAGFPCQPFSIAGVSKKNALGRPHGFECTTQGTLFFDVARIIAAKRPKAFLLENVKNLISHDGGNTFKVIKETLSKELGYHIHSKVIDGQSFVPQHRERILIVGFRESTSFTFEDFRCPNVGPKLKSILHPEDGTEVPQQTPYTTGDLGKVHSKYVLTEHLWKYLQAYAEKHRKAGNGFGFGLVTPDSVARTLSARYYKDGSEILVSRGPKKAPRRLTPRECARLMGYPDTFTIPVSDTQAYKQFGNSVIVPVIAEIARIMEPHVRAITLQDEIGVRELPLQFA